MTGVAAADQSAPASPYGRLKLRTMQMLSATDEQGLRRILHIVLIALIVGNIAAVLLESVQSVQTRWGRGLRAFEGLSVAVFSLEYLLRVWSSTSDPRFGSPLWGRIRFALQPMLLIDLLAILPFYLAAIPFDLRTLRGLRLLRLARALKIGRYSESLQALGRVFVAKREELLTTLLAGMVLVIVASTLMYYIERDRQPEVFSSIPAVMWWAVATLTTVGYGDMCPETVPGKLLGALVAVLGIGLFALPAGILGSGFVEQLQQKKRRRGTCPHCGKSIN